MPMAIEDINKLPVSKSVLNGDWTKTSYFHKGKNPFVHAVLVIPWIYLPSLLQIVHQKLDALNKIQEIPRSILLWVLSSCSSR